MRYRTHPLRDGGPDSRLGEKTVEDSETILSVAAVCEFSIEPEPHKAIRGHGVGVD